MGFHRQVFEGRVATFRARLRRELLHELGFTWTVRPEYCALRNPSVSAQTKQIARDQIAAQKELDDYNEKTKVVRP